MVCPWLVKTVTQTDNKNGYNTSQRSEHQEFDKCLENKCPFYRANYKTNKCLRVKAMVIDAVGMEEE